MSKQNRTASLWYPMQCCIKVCPVGPRVGHTRNIYIHTVLLYPHVVVMQHPDTHSPQRIRADREERCEYICCGCGRPVVLQGRP